MREVHPRLAGYRNGVVAGLVISLVAAHAAATPVGIHITGAPAGWSSLTTAVSADGSVVAGVNVLGNDNRGMYWTNGGGRVDVPGPSPEFPAARFMDVSGDGQTLVGRGRFDLSSTGAVMWRSTTGYTEIPRPSNLSPLYRGTAFAANNNGNVVVGNFDTTSSGTPFKRAFRWTPETGSVDLGSVAGPGGYNDAMDVSQDGNVVVGISQPGGVMDHRIPFVWTSETGMRALPYPPDVGGIPDAAARAVSGNGQVIFGDAPWTVSNNAAVKWTVAGVERILAPAGWFTTGVLASNFDGSLILGQMTRDDRQSGGEFVWTAEMGTISTRDYFARFGITYSQAVRLQVVDVSQDGQTFCGIYTDAAAGIQYGAIVVVPVPGTVVAMSVLALAGTRRRRCG